MAYKEDFVMKKEIEIKNNKSVIDDILWAYFISVRMIDGTLEWSRKYKKLLRRPFR